MRRIKFASSWGSVALLLLVLGAGIFAWQERLEIWDWARLHNYQPPATVQNLASQTTMTPYARHLFYVYHPQLEGSAQFNRNCRVTNQAIVLGCTVTSQGIYLYNVPNSELNGIEQVTAAYEMLHVGYSRLSDSKRKHIDQLVMQAFKTAEVRDPRLKAEEQSYLKTEGASAVPNELHSMMGAEVVDLPPALENYYKQYFTNRQTILNFKNQYQAVFTKRQQTVANADRQLASWKQTITKNEAELDSQSQQLAVQKSQMDDLLAAGKTSAYNARVPEYNSLVQTYNSLTAQTRQLIASYNHLLVTRNAAALQLNQLDQTISSQPLAGSPSTVNAR